MTKSRTWALGTALVVVLVFVAGWLLVISPKRSSASDLHAQVATLATQNQQTEQQISQLKVEQQQLPAQQAQLAAIQQQIPSQPLLPSLLRQVSSTAYNSGVALGTISPAVAITAVPGDQGVSYIPVSMTVYGDFKHLKLFLLGLEKNKRAVLVFSYTIAPAQSTSSSQPVSANLLTLSVQSRVFITSSGSGSTTATAPSTTTGTTTGGASSGTTGSSSTGSSSTDTADSTVSGAAPTSAAGSTKTG